MKKQRRITPGVLNLSLSVAMLALLVAAFLPLININYPWLRIVYCVGAVAAVVVRLLQRLEYRRNPDNPLRVRRLQHIEFWSAVAYLASAYFMVDDPYHPGNWLGFLLAGAALQLFTSFMIPYAEKKESEKKNSLNDRK